VIGLRTGRPRSSENPVKRFVEKMSACWCVIKDASCALVRDQLDASVSEEAILQKVVA
jgi:hypothetical protein